MTCGDTWWHVGHGFPEAELSVQLEGPGRSSPDAVFRPSETDIVASHLARHMIQSISSYENANSASAVSDIDASQNHSLVAQSLTHNILASKVVGGSSAHSMTHSLEQMPSKSETDGVAQRILEPRFGDSSAGSQGYSVGQAPSDAAVQGVAQDLVVGASSHDVIALQSAAESHEQLSQNTDSCVAQSITRNLLLGGMTQSDGHSQHGQMPEETLSDGYVANGIARDVIASAASQHMPAQQNDPSHITSEGVPFHTTQLVARETATVQPVSFASSQPRDIVEQERSDANGDEEVRAILRQTVDMEAFGLPTQGKTPPSQQESAQADSEIAQSIARQIIPPHFGTEGSPREVQEQVQSDAEGYAAHAVARDFVASASKQLPEQRSNPPSQVHSEKTDLLLAESTAKKILEPRFGDSSAGSQGYSVGQAPSDAAVQGVAQDLVVGASSHDVIALQSAAESHEQLSQNTDSCVAQSITRNLLLGGMTQSDGHSQHGQMPEETLSDGYVANGIARDVIASAASQHMPAPQNDPSHITSEGVPFHTTQLVARETATVQPVSFASSQPRDIVEQERSDANGDEEVRAILRQTIDIEAFGLPMQGKTPPSQQESAQADSEIAQSIARQIIPPHFGTEGSPREVQEQVQSDAEGYAAHAVARDFVASASKQLPEQRSNPPSQVHSEKTDLLLAESTAKKILEPRFGDSSAGSQGYSVGQAPSDAAVQGVAQELVVGASSHDVMALQSAAESREQLSQKTDSCVAQSITRNLLLEGMTQSDGHSQHGQMPEETLSDGYVANGIARDVIASAASQHVPTQQNGPSHITSQGEPSHAGQLARETAIVQPFSFASSQPRDVVEQERSDANGDEEVRAILRQTIDIEAFGLPMQGKTPPSQQESAQADSEIAQSIARQIIPPHFGTEGSPREVQEQVQSDAEGYAAHAVARDFVASASKQLPEQRSNPPSQVHSEKTDLLLAESTAKKILEPRFGDSSAGSQGYSVGQAPSDAAVQGVAQELVVGASSHDVIALQSAAESREQLSQNTDSCVAQSITRNLLLGGMTQSDGHSQHGQMPDETLSDGYVANGIARDVIASAASQHVPTQQNGPSHITSQGEPSHAGQLARETAIVQPFSFASSQPRDVVEQERSDANGDEEVRAILRQTVDMEAFGLPTQGKTAPSQQESAQADSEIAPQSIARQIIPPHFGTEGSPREVQEQVQSDAEGYAAHAVARDFVASASKQLPEQRSNPPSQVHSEKTDSAAAHSLAREAVMSPVLE